MSVGSVHRQSFAWGLKYRPERINQLILPQRFINMFETIVEKDELCNMLFVGAPGCGKTSSALAISEELDCDTLYINLSKDTGIDVVKSKISEFGMSVSLTGKRKLVIADECDGASPANKKAMKAEIEKLSDNVGFIFITEFGNAVTAALNSRTQRIDFIFSQEESRFMKTGMYKRCLEILEIENVKYEKPAIQKLMQDIFPDFRKVLNEMQKFSMQSKGDITLLQIENSYNANLDEFFSMLKSKKYKDMRKFIANLAMNPQYFYSDIFNSVEDYIEGQSIPEAITILEEYSYKSSFVIDQELNVCACCFQLIASCKFK